MPTEKTKEGDVSGPRRAAARKATRLAAEQLESSPIRSGGEMDPTAFGEPSRSKAVVKKTYGGKARAKISPLKQTSESSQPSTSRVVRKSKSLSQLSSPTPSRRRKPPPSNSVAPTPAKSSKGKRKEESPAPTISDDSEIELISAPITASRPKINPPAKATPTTNGKKPVQKPTRNSKKRRRSPPASGPQSSASDVSELTPLSSPEPNEMPHPLSGPPASRGLTRTHTSRTIQSISDVEETWDLNKLGTYVWVSINSSGELSEGEDETLWWPAKVVRSGPLTVNLFGNPPNSQGTDAQDKLHIQNPSSKHILSLKTSRGSVRFHEKNYTSHPMTDDLRTSPRKRQKTAEMDLHSRWLDALGLLLRADADDNDGLPSSLSRYASGRMFSEPPGSGDELGDVIEVDEDEWQRPEYSGSMEIPGEPVLAREKKASSDYWPARVMAYIPPEKRSSKPKYEVHYFDGIIKRIPRDMFFAEFDDGFKDCKLGSAAGNYGLDEEEQDHNGDFTMSDDLVEPEESLREASPTPIVPTTNNFAFQYTIPEQFEYVKPVLVAVLQQRYGPARNRHEAFMGSAASRRRVCDSNHSKGNLRALEVEELDVTLRRWIRRRQKRQEMGLIPLDEPDNVSVQQSPSTRAMEDAPDGARTLTKSQEEISTTDNQNTVPQPEGDIVPSPPPSVTTYQDGKSQSSSPKDPPSRDDEQQEHDSATSTNISGGDTPMPPPGSPKSKELSSIDDNPSIEECQIPTVATKQSSSRKTFASLSPIDQITYCTNILLPEAILQLLLWRSGLRTSLELLSPSEEEELHSRAEEKAKEVDWVHAIVYAKRGATGSMLPSSKPGEAPKSNKAVAGTLRSGRNR